MPLLNSTISARYRRPECIASRNDQRHSRGLIRRTGRPAVTPARGSPPPPGSAAADCAEKEPGRDGDQASGQMTIAFCRMHGLGLPLQRDPFSAQRGAEVQLVATEVGPHKT